MNTKIKIIAIVLIGIVLGGIMLFEDQTHSELQSEKDTAVNAYLTVNWTSREILWEHDIMPNDSGRGWEFWLADIDLDGIEEMLISFLANHCGQNSLYVYQYENNSVTLYGDMIAVPDKDVITFIDYKKISPFMDIELVDVYANRQNEYRYLSIDCFSIGGMDQIFLYETVPENNFRQEELANIIYEYNDTEQWEIYFQGERLASTKDLNDMISRHMEGYEKQEICYTHLEKTFPRDIFGMNADQQKRELEELYESLLYCGQTGCRGGLPAAQSIFSKEPQTEEKSGMTTDIDGMAEYYGYYQITQFYPTIYYGKIKYDCLPEQEADMMLGRIVIIEPERLVTYDSERRLGTREGRDGFGGNYIIKEYTIDNPKYECKGIESELIESFPKSDIDKKLENVITIPQLCSPYGTQYYYTLSDADQMILYSTLSNQYFLLEKMEQKQERKMLAPFSDVQKKKLLEEIYGNYEIIQFLPTKFYPAKDSSGYDLLPLEEAYMMIGQEITIKEDFFNTYDNNRRPNSRIADRLEDGFWIAEVKIEHPEYRIERKYRKDIYGLRDNMLPDQITQQEYIEIDVYPGYYAGDNTLPQLFVTEDGKIIMYAMGEYFLLKKS